jgi:hypothetical protein
VLTGKESPTFRNIVLPCGSSSSLDKGTRFLRNVGNHRSIHTALHPRRLKTSEIKLLRYIFFVMFVCYKSTYLSEVPLWSS